MSLERRYALHTALVWYAYQPETTRGQEHAQEAVAIARQLQDPHREAEALHLLGRAYLAEHPGPTREESQIGQGYHEESLRLREQRLGPDHPDVTDTQVANVLVRAAQAAGLLGAQVVLTGIQPEVAQTIITLGVDLRGLRTSATLQSAITASLRADRR